MKIKKISTLTEWELLIRISSRSKWWTQKTTLSINRWVQIKVWKVFVLRIIRDNSKCFKWIQEAILINSLSQLKFLKSKEESLSGLNKGFSRCVLLMTSLSINRKLILPNSTGSPNLVKAASNKINPPSWNIKMMRPTSTMKIWTLAA